MVVAGKQLNTVAQLMQTGFRKMDTSGFLEFSMHCGEEFSSYTDGAYEQ